MALQTTALKNSLADRYAALALFGALYATVPGANPGTELSGGSPAYARKPLTWGTAANGATTASATFDVPAGSTVAGAGVHSALTNGNYLDGIAVTSQSFSTQGQMTVAFTFTQS
ncbi:hypothetical protein ABID92_000446 [Frigoribacterium sp. PvP120]|uniref:hypothetical protein n=1 Tax=unclassified Frigoribacterium TaxID=2627005 RepID=UPI001AE3A1FC|nr:hypothetical protein [Frigoribacterium sp. PvP121]MBP1241726.1 hypothetical protein [Frigoribacterium sp. PvP121]